MKKIIIVGGGAAGLFAAIAAAENGNVVTIIEKNHLCGRKLLITGKGRCNLTSACSREEFFDYIPKNPKFFYSAYANFSNFDTMEFFRNLGVPLKTERGDRVFPESDSARDVRDALVKQCERLKVKVKYSCEVAAIQVESGQAVGVILSTGEIMEAERVVIATGGMSYPLTGSTGDGYKMASAQGHHIVAPRPSLVPMECAETLCKEAQGLALKNIELSVVDEKGKRIFLERGELLFTHFGISGPLVLSASAYMKDNIPYKLFIDLKPALTEEVLDARLLRTFAEFVNKDFENALYKLLPKSLIPIVVRLSKIESGKKVNSITKEERLGLLKTLKGIPLTLTKLRPIDEAIVTAGGIQTKEINPKTMESKLVKGLFFAGEVMDMDALTGGFNLQIAFSTGFLAGKNA